MAGASGDDFSVMVLTSDLGVDARSLLSPSERLSAAAADGDAASSELWHDCLPHLSGAGEDDFHDLEALQVLRVQGSDKVGNRILRIVGKYFPATLISGERLKKYVFRKLCNELSEGPFSILYIHSTVQSADNNPGMSVLRWIYEELPPDYKERLEVFYFLHPGLRSRLTLATLGRFLLSGGLYWKIKYVNRVEFLWEDVKKGQVEIPDFVHDHDKVLEHRPLTDYGIEPGPFRLAEVPSTGYSLGRYNDRWSSSQSM